MLNLRSEREIRLMRKAGLVVWEAHQSVARLVRPGITTREIDQAVEEVFGRHGAEPLFLGVAGPIPFPAVTCISVNEQVVHGIPGDRVLREGDIVSIDTGCRVQGWCGDAAVTYPVGQVSPRVRRLLEVTQGVLDLAIDLLARKDRWSEVAREMQQFVERAGFAVVEQFVGHGIGRQMHEPPPIPNFDSEKFRRDEDFQLEPGLVLAIEPMVNMGRKEVECLPDHWTQVTADRGYSAHFEHTVALTHGGPRILTGPPSPAEEDGLGSAPPALPAEVPR
jgi:methionyl aminopeptidase